MRIRLICVQDDKIAIKSQLLFALDTPGISHYLWPSYGLRCISFMSMFVRLNVLLSRVCQSQYKSSQALSSHTKRINLPRSVHAPKNGPFRLEYPALYFPNIRCFFGIEWIGRSFRRYAPFVGNLFGKKCSHPHNCFDMTSTCMPLLHYEIFNVSFFLMHIRIRYT